MNTRSMMLPGIPQDRLHRGKRFKNAICKPIGVDRTPAPAKFTDNRGKK